MMVLLYGCGETDVGGKNAPGEAGGAGMEAAGTAQDAAQNAGVVQAGDVDDAGGTDDAPEILRFRDVFGEEYEVAVNPAVPPNEYDNAKFRRDGDKLFYDDNAYRVSSGIDVSHHQGYVDWKKVKAAGYDFAFLRIGYRGYGEAGNILKDREFDRNYRNAKDAGVKVGVYFFAQAVNEEEAEEEARCVLEWLDGKEPDLPVVYDPESILDDEARTDGVSGEQFTKNTKRFCEIISDAGYQPMIYANMLWEAFELDLAELKDYPLWYADYEALPQTPYHFTFWQYASDGEVPGVDGSCDLNILIKKQ